MKNTTQRGASASVANFSALSNPVERVDIEYCLKSI